IASCSDDNKGVINPEGDGSIVINGGITSRAVNTEWEAGDEIGVTVYNSDYTQILDNDFNKCYRT
ncbi:MAG: fimbrillin family protein, partial [Bacteroides sp.]|nr:fimbrillin family protein [Bacteroides sp.]